MPTFETREPISVTVEIGVGDIRVAASDRTDTIVEVRPSDPNKSADLSAAEQTRVEYAGGRLLIKAQKGWRRYTPWGGSESIDVQIDLPAGSDVRAEAAVAALHCTGRVGDCRYKTGAGHVQVDEVGAVEFKTGAGDIAVGRAAGQTEITTGSGAVQVGSIDGTAVIKNSNGDTWIGNIGGDLRVKAANGKIVVDRSHASVSAKTANGDIRLGEVARGEVLAETAFGKVEVGILDGVAAWLDLDTKFGNVRNDLGAVGRPESGEDTVEVRAHSAFGDITVGRSFAPVTEREEA
jgi:DUF4097 and DUF4098 domain-containing protein YvlB